MSRFVPLFADATAATRPTFFCPVFLANDTNPNDQTSILIGDLLHSTVRFFKCGFSLTIKLGKFMTVPTAAHQQVNPLADHYLQAIAPMVDLAWTVLFADFAKTSATIQNATPYGSPKRACQVILVGIEFKPRQ
jgi:hypothetical protein